MDIFCLLQIYIKPAVKYNFFALRFQEFLNKICRKVVSQLLFEKRKLTLVVFFTIKAQKILDFN